MKNPMFTTLDNVSEVSNSSTASMRGVLTKTAFLLIFTIVTALVSLTGVFGNFLYPMMIASSIIGFIGVIIARMSPSKAMVGGIIYATCEGLLLGSFSAMFETIYPGAVPIAIIATFSLFMVMLVLYSMKIVAATPTLYKVMGAFGLGILVFSLFTLLGGLFFPQITYLFYSGDSMLGVILAILFIAYGAFMLVLDFNEAQHYVENGYDKKYEWVVSVGLIVSILFIYVKVLRLVGYILQRKD